MAKTLLLADDSVTIQKVVGISFASEDIQITTVDNGDAAVVKARELRPDVILADVVMPGKSGYEVCEAVNADPALRHIPVLLLTGTFEAFDEERARRAGAAGHVAKPFEAQTLVERVKELLARPPAPAPAPEPPAAPPPPLAAPEPAAAPPQASGRSPLPPPAPSADPAFDFFDDAPEPAQNDATRVDFDFAGSSDEALPLDSDDDAFAFGEDDFGAEPAAAAEAAGHTVAMLPGDDDRAAGHASVAAHAPGEALGPDRRGEAPAQGSGEAFDFSFEAADDVAGADAAVAEAALLDPAGDSAFDVSASDLDDLVGSGPEPQAAPPTRVLSLEDEALGASLSDASASGASASGATGRREAAPRQAPDDPFAPRPPAQEPSRPLGEAASPATPRDLGDGFASEAPGAPAPGRIDPTTDPVWGRPEESEPDLEAPAFIEEAPTAPPARGAASAPASALAFAEEDDAEGFLVAAEAEPPAASPASRGPVSDAAAAPLSAGAVLDEIGPALRTQLHETLEKVAWESFGQVTEQLVEQALERIERVAWEVVPRLAETLIQEEIRKLKGGGGSE